MTKKQKTEADEIFDKHLDCASDEYKQDFAQANRIIEKGIKKVGEAFYDAMMRKCVKFELEAQMFGDEEPDSVELDMPYVVVDYDGGNA